MNASKQDRTEISARSRSRWKSAAVVVLIFAAMVMPCSTMLLLKAGAGHVSDSDFHVWMVGGALTLDRPGCGKFSSSLGITS
jgi:hypothetical protein